MKNYTVPVIVRIISRVSGGCLFAFLAFFLLSEIFSQSESGSGFRSVNEFLSFLMFPISTMIGILIALKFEGIGGLIIILGMIMFSILRPDLIISAPVLITSATGILFLAYQVMMKRQTD